LNYGGIIASGHYTIPSSDIIDVGYAAPCPINVIWNATGSPAGQNILTITDILNAPDILGGASADFVDVYPEIQVDPGSGSFGAWQKFVPGVYLGRRFNFRMTLVTYDPAIIPYCLSFKYTVLVPSRIDHYLAQSISSGGTTITFKPDGAGSSGAFNGGPNAGNLPAVSLAWQETAGDVYQLSGLTKSQVTITILNGGVGVNRTGVDVYVEGY